MNMTNRINNVAGQKRDRDAMDEEDEEQVDCPFKGPVVADYDKLEVVAEEFEDDTSTAKEREEAAEPPTKRHQTTRVGKDSSSDDVPLAKQLAAKDQEAGSSKPKDIESESGSEGDDDDYVEDEDDEEKDADSVIPDRILVEDSDEEQSVGKGKKTVQRKSRAKVTGMF